MKVLKIAALAAAAIVAMPVGVIYGMLNSLAFVIRMPRAAGFELYDLGRSISKMLSIAARELLDATLIHKQGVKFGTHTVSAVLGANDREGTLKPIGCWLVQVLDSIERRHCQIAADCAGI